MRLLKSFGIMVVGFVILGLLGLSIGWVLEYYTGYVLGFLVLVALGVIWSRIYEDLD